MRTLLIIFLFVSIFSKAQIHRFYYEYKFTIDSLKKDTLKTEMMILDISNKGSKFMSYDKKVSDSIMDEMRKKDPMNFNYEGIKFGQVDDVVEKEYPNFKINHFINLDMDYYIIQDDRKMNWKIYPDKEKIGEYNTQKATTEMYGRKWTAWFTTDILFQDGPYKFNGLPGLIVKLTEESKTHQFELKGVKNLSEKKDWVNQLEKTFQPITVNPKQYKNILLEYRANPTKRMRQLMSQSGVTLEMMDSKGNKIDINKNIRDREERQKEINKKNNNYLEIDWLL